MGAAAIFPLHHFAIAPVVCDKSSCTEAAEESSFMMILNTDVFFTTLMFMYVVFFASYLCTHRRRDLPPDKSCNLLLTSKDNVSSHPPVLVLMRKDEINLFVIHFNASVLESHVYQEWTDEIATLVSNQSETMWKYCGHTMPPFQKDITPQVIHVAEMIRYLDRLEMLVQIVFFISMITDYDGDGNFRCGNEDWLKKYCELKKEVKLLKPKRQIIVLRMFDVYMNYGVISDGQYGQDSSSMGYYNTIAQSYQPGSNMQLQHVSCATTTAGSSQPHFGPPGMNQSLEAASAAHKYNLRRKRGPSVVEIDENDDEVQYAGNFLNSQVRNYNPQQIHQQLQQQPQRRGESVHHHQHQRRGEGHHTQQQQRAMTTYSPSQRGQMGVRRPQRGTRGSSRGVRGGRTANQARLRAVAPRSSTSQLHYGDPALLHNFLQQSRHNVESASVHGNQLALTHANPQQYFMGNQYSGSNVIDLTQSPDSPLHDAHNRNSVLMNYGASGSTVYQHVPPNSVRTDRSLLYYQGGNPSYAVSVLRNQLSTQPRNVQIGSSIYSSTTNAATATSSSVTTAVVPSTPTAAASGNNQPLLPVKLEYESHNTYMTKFDKITCTTDERHMSLYPPLKSEEKMESYYPQLEYLNTPNYMSQTENRQQGEGQMPMAHRSVLVNPSNQITQMSQMGMASSNTQVPLPMGCEGFNPQSNNNDTGMNELDKYVAEYYLGKFEEKLAVVKPEHTTMDVAPESANENACVPSFNNFSQNDLDSYLNNFVKEENRPTPMLPARSFYQNVMPPVHKHNVVVQPGGSEAAMSQVNYGQQTQNFNNYKPEQVNNVVNTKQGNCIIQNVHNNVTYNVQGPYNHDAMKNNVNVGNDNRMNAVTSVKTVTTLSAVSGMNPNPMNTVSNLNPSTSQGVEDTCHRPLSLKFFSEFMAPWENLPGDSKSTAFLDTQSQNLAQVGAHLRQAQNVVNQNYYDVPNYGLAQSQQPLPLPPSIQEITDEDNTLPEIEPIFTESEWNGNKN